MACTKMQAYSSVVSGKRPWVAHSTGRAIMTGSTSISQVARS
jgi:hypothetical protein